MLSLYHIPCFTAGVESSVWLLNVLFLRDGGSLESSSFALIVRSVWAESAPMAGPGSPSGRHHFSCLSLVGKALLD